MIAPISITAISSISCLGSSSDQIWNSYLSDDHFFTRKKFGSSHEWVSELTSEAKKEIDLLRKSDANYKKLDETVLFAIYSSRKAVLEAGWHLDPARHDHTDFGINIGSSRGATALFEKYFEEFIFHKKTATLASPTTTLGNISSWVAHDLLTQGPEISHSITCSTALHALLNGVAWIQSGMASKFLVGGSEAALTPFTIAQMKALKIYAKQPHQRAIGAVPLEAANDFSEYPCQALNLGKKENTMILGEGAAMACLENGVRKNALAIIEGIGYATEMLEHNISISTEAQCFQRSMKMALGETSAEEVDVIVMHAPGTIKGDIAEYRAIEKVFCNKLPFLTTNKWKVGHTFGASGMLSVELAVLMLRHQLAIKVPFATLGSVPKAIQKIMVNAVGFGGNAVSILLKIPNYT
ncbi:MAG: beta-ketoacyl synthase N-terminal-like domain-containing protein [Flavobacteriaceae bacterium]